MPLLKLNTNIDLDDKIKSKIITDLSTLLLSLTGTDNFNFIFNKITVSIFIQGNEPLVEIECSIPGQGDISFSEIKSFSRKIGDFICERLNIADHRIYLNFSRCS